MRLPTLRFAVALCALLTSSVAAQVQSSPAPAAPPSRIARIIMTPVQKIVTAGDTLRLTGEARDAQGALIPGVQFRWKALRLRPRP